MNDVSYTDLLIIGGGINGVGIARDAAGQGVKVVLCEKGDLGCGTSSASTKLIHGGLRYLEHYEFGLVSAALKEREIILNAAPHIVRPLRFILPQSPDVRPNWLVRVGLFLYDFMGVRRRLPKSGSLDLRETLYGESLNPSLKKAVYYSDCWVDDSRLVILNAIDAAKLGARILPRTECVFAEPNQTGEGWSVTLVDRKDKSKKTIHAKILINAAGPWAGHCLSDIIQGLPKPILRLVRGSHIVVPQLFDHESAYIFQNPDNRIVFAIPYERKYTMIGTTDCDFSGDLDKVQATQDEIEYLCETANNFFLRKISYQNVVWSFSGVRPLLEDGSGSPDKVTRDYRLDLKKTAGGEISVSVFGGKLTTYRKLAEQVIDKVGTVFEIRKPSWTSSAPLPGGEMPEADIDKFIETAASKFQWLPANLLRRYVTSYGTSIDLLLDGATRLDDLGALIGPDLFELEVKYLITHEWAQTAEDILWRRTKLGLNFNKRETKHLQSWLELNTPQFGLLEFNKDQ